MIFLVFTFGERLNISLRSHLYSVSLLLKDFIIFLLPVIIFSFILNGIVKLKTESIRIIIILIPLVCLSNFAGFWTSYAFALPFLKHGFITISRPEVSDILEPSWTIGIPRLVENNTALIGGVLFGLASSLIKSPYIQVYCNKLNDFANFLLKKIICRILPFFILGFVIKMQHEGTLSIIISEYSRLLVVVALLIYLYIFSIIYFLCGRNIQLAIQKVRNLIPGILVGMFSMSSAAAIPNTIQGSEKNLRNREVAQFVVPATANIHLLGDCFAVPIIGLALMASFGYGIPGAGQYLTFTLYGVIAKFAAAGIPGGSVLILLPIFEQVFGFTPQMLTAITAVYLLFDPIATSSNVFGHGMFALLFEAVYKKFKKAEHK
jgi:Na+/H+-dicarboxylate symporter